MSHSQIIVSIARSDEEIERLRPFWIQLNRHPESDIDFVRMLASARADVIRPHIVVAHENGQPIALLVGRLENAKVALKIGYSSFMEIALRQLVFVRDGFLGEQSERVTSLMIETIRASLKDYADRVLFCNVPAGGHLERFAKACSILRRSLFNPIRQHWITRLPSDYEEFLKRRPKKHRYWLRRIGRVFETQAGGKVRYEIVDSLEDVTSFCKAAETVAQKTYQRALGAGFVENDENRSRSLLGATRGWLRGYVAFVDDTPVAFWCAEQIGDIAYLLFTGYDPSYRKFEIGTILFLKMLEDLLGRGVKIIDYGLGGAMYKERFGDVCSEELDLAIYAPTTRALSVNVALALAEGLNRAGQRFLARFKLGERIKRIWRSNLTSHISNSAEGALETVSGIRAEGASDAYATSNEPDLAKSGKSTKSDNQELLQSKAPQRTKVATDRLN